MSSTPMYHPDDGETRPLPEDQGTGPTHAGGSDDLNNVDSTGSSQDETSKSTDTDLEELNDDGVGGTLGAKDTFEPEESDESETGNAPQM